MSSESDPRPDYPSNDALERAEVLYAETLALTPDGCAPDLEGLVERAPELAAELKVIHAGWKWLERKAHVGEESPTVIAGYKVLGELGRGGMGAVYRVFDTRLNRQLALKIAARSTAGSQRARARFLDEAQVTGQLQHPGIVPVHDVGLDEEGHPWFTMSIVEGQDLHARFEDMRSNHAGWDRAQALRALASVADTLAFGHDRGVLHRDLKPSNIMVGPFGQVYVMDWGLARVALGDALEAPIVERGDALATLQGAVIGTPAYMSPEQARGEICTPASDIYSLGAILYELLRGSEPYRDVARQGSSQALVDAVRSGPPVALSMASTGAPAELLSIVSRAMARDPRQRYANMQAFARDLRAFLEQRVVSAHKRRLWTPLAKWYRRNRGLSAALAGVLVALVAGGLREWRARSVLEDAFGELGLAKGRADEARMHAEQASYVAQVAAAQAKLELGQGDLALEDLLACPPELRGWEWQYLASRLRTANRIIDLDPAPTSRSDFAVSPDRAWLAVVGAQRPEYGVYLHDLRSGSRAYIPTQKGSRLFGLMFNETSSELITVDTYGKLTRWTLGDEPELIKTTLCRSPGGYGRRNFEGDARRQRVALNMADNRIQVRDMVSQKLLYAFAGFGNELMLDFSFRPDSDELFIVTDSYDLVRLDLAESAIVARRNLAVPGRLDLDLCIEVSPDGSKVAVALPSGRVELCDAETLESLGTLPVSSAQLNQLAFDPSGAQLLCTTLAPRAEIWDTSARRRVTFLEGSGGAVLSAIWQPNWPNPISVHRSGQVHYWAAQQTGWLEWHLGGNLPAAAAVDAARGRLYAIQSDGVPLIYNLDGGHVMHTLPVFRGVLTDARMTRLGGDLLCHYWLEHDELVLRDGETLEILGQQPLQGRASRLDVDDAGQLALQIQPTFAHVHELPSLTPGIKLESDEPLGAALFDTVPGQVLLGLTNGSLERRSLADGSVLASLDLDLASIWALARSTRLDMIAVAGDGRVLVLDAEDLATLATLDTVVDSSVVLSFSADGSRLALGNRDLVATQGVMQLFDPRTGSRMATLGRADRSLSEARFATGSSLAVAKTFEGSVVVLSPDSDLHVDLEPLTQAARAKPLVEELARDWPLGPVLVNALARDESIPSSLRTAAVRMALDWQTDLDAVEEVLDKLSHGAPLLMTEPELCMGMVELYCLTVGVHRAGPYLACIHASQGSGDYARGVISKWAERAKPSQAVREAWLARVGELEAEAATAH